MKSLFNWVGGKSRSCSKICEIFPPHTVYVEPFFGAGSVFFCKPPVKVEVINDIDQDVYNFYKILRDPDKYSELLHKIEFTQYSRRLYKESYDILKTSESDIERAWAFYIRVTQGYGARLQDNYTWCAGTTVSRPKVVIEQKSRLQEAHHRLMGAYIEESLDAIEVIMKWDSPDTLFYLDPPYVQSNRTQHRLYRNEIPNSYHQTLTEAIRDLKGYVFLHGYENDYYNSLGWVKSERLLRSSLVGNSNRSSVKNTEILWINRKSAEEFLDNSIK